MDYQVLAGKRGFQWLGPEVATTHTKTGWECGQGHRWAARYHDIQAGYGCPHCWEMRRGQSRRKRAEDYRALACGCGLMFYEDASLDVKQRRNRKSDAEKAIWAVENGYHLVILWQHEIEELGAWPLVRNRVLPLLLSWMEEDGTGCVRV